ncbi:glutaredoxin family protein [Virgibacillus alimentarius]|uniref:Glutaredoxin n=1 Tax=Virgibacillus alimentarius TaxID=698769 RepID=A0ABS4S5T6_9BACI|nr:MULTISPECIES: glutaredoxin family protein [Virgibacillus]MBP2256860.1 glutaredoxin [Virgibacillus alimentarius]HLR69542.1 glutaredoxin family protein [Virgibacillus sp.]
MLQIKFYTKENCPLCEDAEALLTLLRNDYPFVVDKRNIDTNETWLEAYQLNIPVIDINGRQLDCRNISFETLNRVIQEHV